MRTIALALLFILAMETFVLDEEKPQARPLPAVIEVPVLRNLKPHECTGIVYMHVSDVRVPTCTRA